MRTPPLLPAATLLVALTASGLSACAGAEEAPLPARTAANGDVFNDADATFASELLQQRAEELVLIDLTIGKDLSPELGALVEEARSDRSADVQTASGWLTQWGEEIPSTVRDHEAMHEESDGHDELESEDGAAFEAAWIDAFLAEIDDVEPLLADEQADGANAAAKELAEDAEARLDDESDALEDIQG